MPTPASNPQVELAAVMRLLRARCPWKSAQTHASLARYLLEETHETLQAIDLLDEQPESVAHLCEELGDLLLQVHFHAAIAEEAGRFSVDDVARGLLAKLYRRNPHVFGPDAGHPQTAGAVNVAWQQIKAAEQSGSSVTDALPPTLPALLLAAKALDRLSRTAGHAQPGELPGPVGRAAGLGDDAERELGDRLLGLVVEARSRDLDPEQALRGAVRRLLSAGEASTRAGQPDDAGGV